MDEYICFSRKITTVLSKWQKRYWIVYDSNDDFFTIFLFEILIQMINCIFVYVFNMYIYVNEKKNWMQYSYLEVNKPFEAFCQFFVIIFFLCNCHEYTFNGIFWCKLVLRSFWRRKNKNWTKNYKQNEKKTSKRTMFLLIS